MTKLLTAICCFSFLTSFSQSNYFQQQVDYTIDVSLNDRSHILSGFDKMIYKNNSKDTLKFIYFHLWPNAYKNDKTAFCEQQVENGVTKFYYSKEDSRGFIDSIDFKVNNETVSASNLNNYEDVIILELNEPLAPAKSIEISTPFRVVLPEVFSRMGHKGQTYQISQWYPKPAVYDAKGWHPLPYLDQGEFYSEYGSFDVSINLPSNYIVAATGDLQDESEKQFMEEQLTKHDSTISYKNFKTIESATTRKTIRFKQNNVHDFAWFASKEFQVERSFATLENGKKISCYSYFKPYDYRIYHGSSKVIAQTISYLSEHVGEYPYAHASIVDGTLDAGGGMEYPNVTVIGSVSSKALLQTVIIHEVGHNWFYGLLGSNEREHPWMDEGINSYYEKVIDAKLKKENSAASHSNTIGDNIMNKFNGNFAYLLSAMNATDQAIELPSTRFTNLNYGGDIYTKTQLLLNYLHNYLGDVVFDKCMKSYFTKWQYKHPYPSDFREVFEKESGKNIAWFFDEGLHTTKKIDFKIGKPRHEQNATLIGAKSRTNFKGPIPISALNKDSVLKTEWIEYPYDQKAQFNTNGIEITSYNIDALNEIPELKISNNTFRTKGLFHRVQPKLKLGMGLGISKYNELYLLPAIGYNFYDKTMLGLVIHNLKIPNHKFQFALAPMYSFNAKAIVGTGMLSYTAFPNAVAQRIQFGIRGSSFHENESHLNLDHSLFLRYLKLAPSISIDFKKSSAISPINNNVLLTYYFIQNQSFNYTKDVTDSLYRPFIDAAKTTTNLASLNFLHTNNRTFNPYSYEVYAQGNQSFVKLGLEGNLKIDYFKKGKAFYARFFGGKFFDLKNSSNPFLLRNQYLNTNYTAANDFIYDETYLARNEQKGFLTHQAVIKEGGFKIQTPYLSSPLGQSDNWLTAINLRTDLPFKFPIKTQLFLDAGTFAKADKLNPSGNKTLYDAGLEFHFFNNTLSIYVPLFMSKDFKNYVKSQYAKNRILNTMSFSLNFSKLDLSKTQEIITF